MWDPWRRPCQDTAETPCETASRAHRGPGEFSGCLKPQCTGWLVALPHEQNDLSERPAGHSFELGLLTGGTLDAGARKAWIPPRDLGASVPSWVKRGAHHARVTSGALSGRRGKAAGRRVSLSLPDPPPASCFSVSWGRKMSFFCKQHLGNASCGTCQACCAQSAKSDAILLVDTRDQLARKGCSGNLPFAGGIQLRCDA